MLETRNTDLIVHARKVYIRALVVSRPHWQSLYATPSSIRWTTRSRSSVGGTYYETTLDVDFPGMGRDQFAVLHKLANSYTALQVATNNGDLYELCSEQATARVSYNFQNFGTRISFESADRLPPYFVARLDGNSLMPQLLPLISFEVGLNVVDSFIEVELLFIIIKKADLVMSRYDITEMDPDKAYQDAPVVEYFKKIFHHRQDHMLGAGIGDLALLGMGLKI